MKRKDDIISKSTVDVEEKEPIDNENLPAKIFSNDAGLPEGTEIIIQDDDKKNDDELFSFNQNIVKVGANEVLAQYIQKVSSFPMLTQEEEEKLFNLYIDKGDQKAGQAIVLSHLRLVVKIAMQYKNFGINMMDIIAEGNVGLMIALQKFDRTKKARFSTYAGLWVKAKVQEFILRSWSMIKIGSSALRKQLLFNFNGVKKLLHIDGDTSPKEENKKMAQHFGISEGEYENAISAIKSREASLDSPIGDDDKSTIIDTIKTDNGNFGDKLALQEENFYRNKIFQESLSILDERQKSILIARYLQEPKATLEDLSQKYNISKERVRQIEESAIKKLK